MNDGSSVAGFNKGHRNAAPVRDRPERRSTSFQDQKINMPDNTLLFIDIATVLGFAVGRPADKPISGSVSLRTKASHPGTKGCLFGDWLGPQLVVHRPARVIFEAPMMMMPKADGSGAGGNTGTMLTLIGLAELAKVICCRYDIPIFPVASSTVRKWFLGNGRPENPKLAVMQECRRRGWSPIDDNEGDALAGLDYALGLYYPNEYRRSYRT